MTRAGSTGSPAHQESGRKGQPQNTKVDQFYQKKKKPVHFCCICLTLYSKMKLSIGIIFCSLVLGVSSREWFTFLKEAGQGAKDMWRAYSDMREANYKGADKYFHARGNYDAARRGPGGAWAAKVISDARENAQRVTDLFKFGDSGHGAADSRADQAANEWGRSGKDPNHFRPRGLPDKY
uniref:Serum amyloid A protein n=1 Tax=Equus caballus TaxID=9796 RepID=A0A9R1SMB9_HORSE